MNTHVRFSPSQLAAYEACPQYRPSPLESDAAAEGKLLHEAMALGKREMLQEKEHLALFDRCSEFLGTLQGDAAIVEVFRELPIKVTPRDFMGPHKIQGTADFVMLIGDHAILVDFKFGRNLVPPAEVNPQLQTYAVGLFDTFERLKTIEAIIVQPRERLIDRAMLTRDRCDSILLRVCGIIARVEEGTNPATPETKACLYCGNKGNCPALHKAALYVGENLGYPTVWNPAQVLLPEDMAKMQTLSKLLEDWCGQVRKENARRVLQDGIQIPGYRLVERAGTPSINDTSAAAQKLQDAGLLGSPEELLVCSKVSLPSLVDYVNATKKEGDDKKKVRDLIEHVLEDVLTYGEPTRFLQATHKSK